MHSLRPELSQMMVKMLPLQDSPLVGSEFAKERMRVLTAFFPSIVIKKGDQLFSSLLFFLKILHRDVCDNIHLISRGIFRHRLVVDKPFLSAKIGRASCRERV